MASRTCPRDGDVFLVERRMMMRMKTALTGAGLSLLQIHDLYLPSTVVDVSEHLLIPAKALGLNAYNLPIVTLILATK